MQHLPDEYEFSSITAPCYVSEAGGGHIVNGCEVRLRIIGVRFDPVVSPVFCSTSCASECSDVLGLISQSQSVIATMKGDYLGVMEPAVGDTPPGGAEPKASSPLLSPLSPPLSPCWG
jgi:DNA-directed RNA polymerase subunit E'/Rpb7